MLSDFWIAIALAFAILLLCFLSFRWGVRFGSSPSGAAERSLKPDLPRRKRQESKEMEKLSILRENIEHDAGDGSSQRTIL